MNIIEREYNWGFWDKLDDKPLKHGEKLRIRWPNGKIENVTIIIERHAIPMQDMDRNYYASQDVRAYVESTYNGVKILVPVVGLEAERREM